MNKNFDLRTPSKIIRDPNISPAPGLAVMVLPNKKQVLTSGSDFHLRLWDIEKGVCIKSWHAGGPLHSIQVIEDASIALLGAVQGIVLWDLKDWNLCDPNTLWSYSMLQTVACAASTGEVLGCGEDTTIHRWNLQTREKIGQLPGHEITITAVDIAPSGSLAITGDLIGEIRLWDLSENKCIKIWKGHAKKVSALQFASNGRLVLSGSEDGSLVLWELPSVKAVCRIEEDWITDIVLSKDAREAICCSRNGVSHWSLADETLIARYSHENVVKIGLSPDGSVLAGLVRSNNVLVWDRILPEA